MTLSMQDAVRRAEMVVKQMGAEYDDRLRGHLRNLQKAFDENDRDQAILIAHTMKGESGMFEWPLVSEIAGWLRQILETKDEFHRTEVIELHLHTLRIIISENLKGEAPAGQKLIRNLYAVIEKKGLIP